MMRTPIVYGAKKASELDPDVYFAYVFYVSLSCLCMLTFLVLLYITIKVMKKVGTTDIIIQLMLFLLQLSAISKCLSVPPYNNPLYLQALLSFSSTKATNFAKSNHSSIAANTLSLHLSVLCSLRSQYY